MSRVPASDVLAGSLAESAALASQTKTILRKQVKKLSDEIDRADTNQHRKSELLRQILEISTVLNQNVESLGRLLHKPIASTPEPPSETPTAEQVLAEITHGVGRGKRAGRSV
jgi:hypothetical protein